jgi:hypothetical protein
MFLQILESNILFSLILIRRNFGLCNIKKGWIVTMLIFFFKNHLFDISAIN